MAILLGLLKALAAYPSFKEAFDSFFVWYANEKIASLKAEDSAAVRKAVTDHDQRPIENAIGSPIAGKPSQYPGTSVIGELPDGLSKPSGN